MTVSNPDIVDARDMRDDQGQDFDLRRYLEVVLSWWKEILLLALLAAIVAGLGVILRRQIDTPRYEAIADIVATRLVSEIALEGGMVISGDMDADSAAVIRRRAALTTLAASDAIAAAVAADLGDMLSEDERNPDVLLGFIEVESPTTPDGRSPSDLIRIRVTATNPDKAAAIANSWAEHFIALANSAFGQVPSELTDSVQAELQDAAETHQAAQNTLEDYIATSRIDRLQQEIDRLVAQRDNLLLGRQEVLAAIIEQDRAARVKLFTDLTGAQSGALVNVVRNQSRSQLDNLTELYGDRDRALRHLGLARSLQEQIRLGGQGAVATNHQSLQLLKNQVYSLPEYVENVDGTMSPVPSYAFITESADVLPSAEEQQADVQALVAALEAHIVELDANIEEASRAVLSGDEYQFLDQINAQSLTTSAAVTSTTDLSATVQSGDGLSAAIMQSYMDLFGVGGLVQASQVGMPEENSFRETVDELDRRIQELRAERAAEDAQLQLLTQQRDIAWNAYTALSRKAVELGIEETAATTEVRMGAPAIPPSVPIAGPSLTVTSALAGTIGLLTAIFLALMANQAGYTPIFKGRKA